MTYSLKENETYKYFTFKDASLASLPSSHIKTNKKRQKRNNIDEEMFGKVKDKRKARVLHCIKKSQKQTVGNTVIATLPVKRFVDTKLRQRKKQRLYICIRKLTNNTYQHLQIHTITNQLNNMAISYYKHRT